MIHKDTIELITRIVLQQLAGNDSVIQSDIGNVETGSILFVVPGSQVKIEETLAWLPTFRETIANPGIVLDLNGTENNFGDKPFYNNDYGTIIKQTDGMEADERVASAEAVVIPQLGQELAVKMALGLNDTWTAKIAISAIMKGKPVFAAFDEIMLPETTKKLYPMMPASYLKLFNEYRKTLTSLNIRIMPRDDLGSAVRQFIRGGVLGNQRTEGEAGVKVLTESDVLKYHEMSSIEIRVPPRCIVTPLARETAAKMGLTISIMC